MTTYFFPTDQEERRERIHALRADPSWKTRGEEAAKATKKARRDLATATRKAQGVDALERLAHRASPTAVTKAITEAEHWVAEAALDSGIDEESIASEVTQSYVSVEVIGARRNVIKFGIAAEVFRCSLGWTYAETNEWLEANG